MKYFLFMAIVLSSCTAAYKVNYTTVETPKEKTLIGIINRDIIEADTAFKWFGINFNFAQPDVAAIDIFKQKKNDFKIIVFGGTWCEDTQNLLPMFYKLIEKSGYSQKKITLVGVDRQKQSGNELSAKYKIKNVPAFIILKNDETEVGRVVEYGKGNGIDKELGEIVNSIK